MYVMYVCKHGKCMLTQGQHANPMYKQRRETQTWKLHANPGKLRLACESHAMYVMYVMHVMRNVCNLCKVCTVCNVYNVYNVNMYVCMHVCMWTWKLHANRGPACEPHVKPMQGNADMEIPC